MPQIIHFLKAHAILQQATATSYLSNIFVKNFSYKLPNPLCWQVRTYQSIIMHALAVYKYNIIIEFRLAEIISAETLKISI